MGKRYTADDIQVLKGLEAVRKRPSMYLGDLDSPRSLTRLVEQMMCASLDEAIAGRCSRIRVMLHADGSASVDDDGPGMRTDNSPREGRSWIEIMLTTLSACRAMRENEAAKKFCGIGICLVNAFAESFTVENRREGRTWTQSFRQSLPLAPLADVGPAETSGVTFRFLPDPTLLNVRQFDAPDLRRLIDEIRRDTNVEIQLVDER
jgi:DNA gyrase subunit B